MRRVTRHFTALTLVLAMVFTAISVGVVRGQTEAVATFVICTGHGTVAVHVDADGNQTGAPHLCPDCVMTLLTAVPPWQPAASDGVIVETVLQVAAAAHAPVSAGQSHRQARGPPRLV